MMFNDLRTPPIQCLLESRYKAVETYCYIQSVFTVKGNGKNYELHPGVGASVNQPVTPTYQKYFFWLPYLLAAQVLLLGFPHFLWKTTEGGFMAKLLGDLNEVPYADKMVPVAKYLLSTLHWHNMYALKFLACELLGVIVLVANVFLTDWYLEGRFFQAVPLMLQQLIISDRHDDLLDWSFPKVAKCSFHLYGGSGTVMLRDALCVMGRNLLTGRMYMMLFVVFTTSALLSCLSIIWRISSFSSKKARAFVLTNKVPVCVKKDLRRVLATCDFGDWFLLLQMATQMTNFPVFVNVLRQELQQQQRTENSANSRQTAVERLSSL